MTAAASRVYGFVLTLAGETTISDRMEDAVFQAGCDDALLWARGAHVHLHFDREAATLGEAIGSAINDVERAGYSVARVDVEGVKDANLPVTQPFEALP